jgi:pyrroloquinoline quinone biosynthesis protein B
MYLGKEAIDASGVPVHVMPGMKGFLEKNGPWDQLIRQDNIQLYPMKADSVIVLSPDLSILPFRVPHRDEYSETVGYEIRGPHKKVLFIPDIDKWERWDRQIEELISWVDYAFLDATFYSGDELNTRNLEEIPHPFVMETLSRFDHLPAADKQKIRFIHFNHTNPLLSPDSDAFKKVVTSGYGVAEFLEKIAL